MHVIIAFLCFFILLSISPTARRLTAIVVLLGIVAYTLHCNETGGSGKSIPITTTAQAGSSKADQPTSNERTRACETQKGQRCLNLQSSDLHSLPIIAPRAPPQSGINQLCRGIITRSKYANPNRYEIDDCSFYGLDAAGKKIFSACSEGSYCVVNAIGTAAPDFYIKRVISAF